MSRKQKKVPKRTASTNIPDGLFFKFPPIPHLPELSEAGATPGSILGLRLQQARDALAKMTTSDLSGFRPMPLRHGGRTVIKLDFSGGMSAAQLKNFIDSVIINVGCLKDGLNNWCKANDKEPLGEKLVDTNNDVAIMHDLYNVLKHGPARPSDSRSGLYPELQNICRALEFADNSSVRIMPLATNGPHISGDTARLAIDADILTKGKSLGKFRAIAERAIRAWESAMKIEGVVM